jgi:hypothetical protein
VGLATLGAIGCAISTVIVLGVALSRDPRKSQGLARGFGTLGMMAGLLGAAFGASEFEHQDWTFAAFVVGSLVACIAAFLWFESRCMRAARWSLGEPMPGPKEDRGSGSET